MRGRYASPKQIHFRLASSPAYCGEIVAQRQVDPLLPEDEVPPSIASGAEDTSWTGLSPSARKLEGGLAEGEAESELELLMMKTGGGQ